MARSQAGHRERHQLEDGDLMVLYTDGITDARARNGKQLDPEGLVRWFEEVADRPVEQIRDRVMAKAVARALKQDDDMSLVLVRKNQR